jgi:hypothetical protein
MLTDLLLLPGLYFVFAEADRLHMNAEPAVTVLALQRAESKLVQLPADVEFRLSVTSNCAGGGRPESLSVTIADTVMTVGGEELQATDTLELVVRVPASQLAPLALGAFCVDPASEGASILAVAALTAQASLRCSRGEDQSIVYAAKPLDIRVYCIPAAATPVEAARD